MLGLSFYGTCNAWLKEDPMKKDIAVVTALLFIVALFAGYLLSCTGGGRGGSASSIGIPQNVIAGPGPGVQKTTISWNAVSGATSYNLYWSNSAGVNKTNGMKILNATSPYTHLQLYAGTYYYVVTALDANGESIESSQASAPVNLVTFITSTSGDGNIESWIDAGGKTGLAAADAVCQARALASGLTGTFKAWLSDANDDAYCRVHNLTGKRSANCGQGSLPVSAGPWVRMDGFPFGATIDLLLDNGVVYAPIRYDETGTTVAGPVVYVTNTDIDGSIHSSYPTACSNWTSNSGSVWTIGGNIDMTSRSWTNHVLFTCSANDKRLACMQTGSGPSLPSFASMGKKVFLTSTKGTGDLGTWPGAAGKAGLAAGDAICQNLALASNLAGTFKAWLSDSTTDAKNRLMSNGPWVRLDGVKVAENKADLTKGALFTSINQSETGAYDSNYGVWSGSTADGLKTANTCSNWTDGTSSFSGSSGAAASAGSSWSNNASGSFCNSGFALYCFED
jgi:hypothetical protein